MQHSLIGLARDLRGVAYAFNTKTSYMMLYDWLYPNYFPVLRRGVELWYHEPALTTPVLKLMCELAQNRSQRLQFDVSSPNGVLLFREISSLLVAYGESESGPLFSLRALYAVGVLCLPVTFSSNTTG